VHIILSNLSGLEVRVARIESDESSDLTVHLPPTGATAFITLHAAPVPDIKAELLNARGELIAVARTAADGSLLFQFVVPDVYRLMVSRQLLRTFQVASSGITEIGTVELPNATHHP
jgi:hypothetical protein